MKRSLWRVSSTVSTLTGIQHDARSAPAAQPLGRSRLPPSDTRTRAGRHKASHAAAGPHRGARRRNGLHHSISSASNGFRGIPRSSATFFWKVMIVSARCRRRSSRAFVRCQGGLLPLGHFFTRVIPGRRLPATLLRRQAVLALLTAPERHQML